MRSRKGQASRCHLSAQDCLEGLAWYIVTIDINSWYIVTIVTIVTIVGLAFWRVEFQVSSVAWGLGVRCQISTAAWGCNRARTWTMTLTKSSKRRRRRNVKMPQNHATVAPAGHLMWNTAGWSYILKAHSIPRIPTLGNSRETKCTAGKCSLVDSSANLLCLTVPEAAEMPTVLVMVLPSEEASNRFGWSPDALKTWLESLE